MHDANAAQACSLRSIAPLPWAERCWPSRTRVRDGMNVIGNDPQQQTGSLPWVSSLTTFAPVMPSRRREPWSCQAVRCFLCPLSTALRPRGRSLRRAGTAGGFIRGVPWDVGLVRSVLVWPPPETKPATKEQYNTLPEGSPWKEGPWLQELDCEVRDTLATVDDARLPASPPSGPGSRNSINTMTTEVALSLIRDLVGLARRARDAGDRLYCWLSL